MCRHYRQRRSRRRLPATMKVCSNCKKLSGGTAEDYGKSTFLPSDKSAFLLSDSDGSR